MDRLHRVQYDVRICTVHRRCTTQNGIDFNGRYNSTQINLAVMILVDMVTIVVLSTSIF